MDSAPETTHLQGGPAIAIRAQLPFSELPAFFGRAFGELAACAQGRLAGPPFARYHRADSTGVDVEAAMPVRGPVELRGRVYAVELDGGPAVQIRHRGAYDQLGETYATLERWLKDNGQSRSEAVREIYLTGPSDVSDPAEHVTLVVQPLQAAPATVQVDGP